MKGGKPNTLQHKKAHAMSSSSKAPPPPPPGVGNVGTKDSSSKMGLSDLKKGGGGGARGSEGAARAGTGVGVTATNSSQTKNANAVGASNALHRLYPVNSIMELTISPTKEVVKGLIYCTDEISSSVVVMATNKASQSTYDIRVINSATIMNKKIVKDIAPKEGESVEDGDEIFQELVYPLPHVNKIAIEEKERRAVQKAEESLKHINPKATPKGQKVFETLLKACNEVVWTVNKNGESKDKISILVSNQIRVDPPYTPDNCTLVQKVGGQDDDFLKRVQRILESTMKRN